MRPIASARPIVVLGVAASVFVLSPFGEGPRAFAKGSATIQFRHLEPTRHERDDP